MRPRADKNFEKQGLKSVGPPPSPSPSLRGDPPGSHYSKESIDIQTHLPYLLSTIKYPFVNTDIHSHRSSTPTDRRNGLRSHRNSQSLLWFLYPMFILHINKHPRLLNAFIEILTPACWDPPSWKIWLILA